MNPLSKEEFLEKLKIDREFNSKYGRKHIIEGKMVLPPCHYGFQVYTREIKWYNDLDKIKEIYIKWSLSKGNVGYAGDLKADTVKSANQIFTDGWQNRKDPFTNKPLIELECFSSIPTRAISLMWTQRSVDVGLGLPFNIASYALLLEIIAKMTNMIPDELIGNLGDTHIYLNHVDGVKEQLTRTPFELPSLNISSEVNFNGSIDDFLNSCSVDSFKLTNYKSHPAIKMPLSN